MTHFQSELIKIADFSSPPGEILVAMIAELGMKQSQFAKLINRPAKTLNEIIKGKCAITPATAIQFEKVFGLSAEYWVLREARYRLFLERRKKA